MQGILPYAGLKFYVYQSMKNKYRTWQLQQDKDKKQQQHHQQQQQHEHHSEHHLPPPPPFLTSLEQAQAVEEEEEEQQRPQKLPVAVTLVFGGSAGLVAQTVTYPLVSYVLGYANIVMPEFLGGVLCTCMILD
jgi:ABC-type nickel/cobalt efflux system permease component RcnA